MNFIEELQWRGMLHTMSAGADQKLNQGPCVGYVGFDPTAPSLQLGNLIPIMMLVHFQRSGHKPIALVGEGTVMIGDPSGRSEERPLLSLEEIQHNRVIFRKQLAHFLDFEKGSSAAEIVNNVEWLREINLIQFLRDIGKHLTVNYMLAKDSVQLRLPSGISFTEFSYQLLQAYDFLWLFKHKKCTFQFGGSDQWGNITSGTELIRRKESQEAYAVTCPLLTRADGQKFGKSAAGERIWLDPSMTSPYAFYQFWLNTTDEDAKRFLRTFTVMSQPEIEEIESLHEQSPHLRHLQKTLARDMTMRVHSADALQAAESASQILFGNATFDTLKGLSEKDFIEIFHDVPHHTISKSAVETGLSVTDLCVEKSPVFASKGEARRMIASGGVMINKIKITSPEEMVGMSHLLNNRYILLQKGKKNYTVIIVD
ncbi:MAG: tyrosine--tRNA ligase [Chitinivibrionales bacterium]|nr:tyrosine--tRNA ligase [Chitinivibrionales bacterium]